MDKMEYRDDNAKGGERYIDVGPHKKDAIIYFGEDYWFLSNFFPCEVTYKGVTYPTTEHAFQAMKTKDKKLRKEIAALKSPNGAKYVGRTLTIRSDWEDIKFDVMEDLLRLKFSKPYFSEKLLATGKRDLIEGNWWHDRIWGMYQGSGENRLGKMLMRLRKELMISLAKDS
jgi:N-glycosidase YbiA